MAHMATKVRGVRETRLAVGQNFLCSRDGCSRRAIASFFAAGLTEGHRDRQKDAVKFACELHAEDMAMSCRLKSRGVLRNPIPALAAAAALPAVGKIAESARLPAEAYARAPRRGKRGNPSGLPAPARVYDRMPGAWRGAEKPKRTTSPAPKSCPVCDGPMEWGKLSPDDGSLVWACADQTYPNCAHAWFRPADASNPSPGQIEAHSTPEMKALEEKHRERSRNTFSSCYGLTHRSCACAVADKWRNLAWPVYERITGAKRPNPILAEPCGVCRGVGRVTYVTLGPDMRSAALSKTKDARGKVTCPGCGGQGYAEVRVNPRVPVVSGIGDTTLEKWEERDRLHIMLLANRQPGRKGTGDATVEIAEWWDDDARSMFEDGFFDARRLHDSVYRYAVDVGLVRERGPGGRFASTKRNPAYSYCGERTWHDPSRCHYCKTAMDKGAKFCGVCGKPFIPEPGNAGQDACSTACVRRYVISGGKVRRNPLLTIVTGNPGPSAAAVEAAWCKFHQRDTFDGDTARLDIRGVPPMMFALGTLVALDLGDGDQRSRGHLWVACNPEDSSLWIIGERPSDAMDVSKVRSWPVRALTYGTHAWSGKDEAAYKHDFHRPFPTIAPVGDAKKCRAFMLDGGRYVVTDWIRK